MRAKRRGAGDERQGTGGQGRGVRAVNSDR